MKYPINLITLSAVGSDFLTGSTRFKQRMNSALNESSSFCWEQLTCTVRSELTSLRCVAADFCASWKIVWIVFCRLLIIAPGIVGGVPVARAFVDVLRAGRGRVQATDATISSSTREKQRRENQICHDTMENKLTYNNESSEKTGPAMRLHSLKVCLHRISLWPQPLIGLLHFLRRSGEYHGCS